MNLRNGILALCAAVVVTSLTLFWIAWGTPDDDPIKLLTLVALVLAVVGTVVVYRRQPRDG